MPETLFFSHSSKDDAVVTEIHDELELHTDVDVWVDHKDIITDDWNRSVQKALYVCTGGLIAISPNAVESDACQSEWTILKKRNIPIYVILLEPVEDRSFPWQFVNINYLSYCTDPDDTLQKLILTFNDPASPQALEPAQMRRLTECDARDHQTLRQLRQIPLYGRDDALKATHEALNDAGLGSITGVGGIGKSRLAAEVLDTYAEVVEGALWYVCGPGQPPNEVYARLREHFGIPNDDTQSDKARVLPVLRDHQTLVVLDNGESVLPDKAGAYAQLATDLHGAGAQVLITSRANWSHLDARTVDLNQYKLPVADAVCMARKMAGVRGLVDKLPDDDAVLAEFVNKAHLHPRLIEWAIINRLKRKPFADVMVELTNLTSRKAQEALEEMIGQTITQMAAQHGEQHRNALIALATCIGGFTYAAGQFITALDDDDYDDVLEVLLDWSFLSLHEDRYTLHPITVEVLNETKG